jgi:hypothetical protein
MDLLKIISANPTWIRVAKCGEGSIETLADDGAPSRSLEPLEPEALIGAQSAAHRFQLEGKTMLAALERLEYEDVWRSLSQAEGDGEGAISSRAPPFIGRMHPEQA